MPELEFQYDPNDPSQHAYAVEETKIRLEYARKRLNAFKLMSGDIPQGTYDAAEEEVRLLELREKWLAGQLG